MGTVRLIFVPKFAPNHPRNREGFGHRVPTRLGTPVRIPARFGECDVIRALYRPRGVCKSRECCEYPYVIRIIQLSEYLLVYSMDDLHGRSYHRS